MGWWLMLWVVAIGNPAERCRGGDAADGERTVAVLGCEAEQVMLMGA